MYKYFIHMHTHCMHVHTHTHKTCACVLMLTHFERLKPHERNVDVFDVKCCRLCYYVRPLRIPEMNWSHLFHGPVQTTPTQHLLLSCQEVHVLTLKHRVETHITLIHTPTHTHTRTLFNRLSTKGPF